MVETITKAWPFGVAEITGRAGTIYLAAAFCFDTPDGLAIVTPGYLDPAGGAHNFHRIAANVRQQAGAIIFEGPEYSGRIERYEPTAEQIERIGDALEWFEGALAEAGINVDAERERLLGILGPDLGMRPE